MESLPKLCLSLEIPPRVKENLQNYLVIRKNWVNLMKERAREAIPLSLEEGVLHIGVFDHYVLQELSTRYLEILEKIKGLFPGSDCPVRQLKFLFARERLEAPSGLKARVKLKEEELNALKKLCESLADEELGLAFLNLLKSYVGPFYNKNQEVKG